MRCFARHETTTGYEEYEHLSERVRETPWDWLGDWLWVEGRDRRVVPSLRRSHVNTEAWVSRYGFSGKKLWLCFHVSSSPPWRRAMRLRRREKLRKWRRKRLWVFHQVLLWRGRWEEREGKRRTWRRGERTCTPFNHGGDTKGRECISQPLREREGNTKIAEEKIEWWKYKKSKERKMFLIKREIKQKQEREREEGSELYERDQRKQKDRERERVNVRFLGNWFIQAFCQAFCQLWKCYGMTKLWRKNSLNRKVSFSWLLTKSTFLCYLYY